MKYEINCLSLHPVIFSPLKVKVIPGLMKLKKTNLLYIISKYSCDRPFILNLVKSGVKETVVPFLVDSVTLIVCDELLSLTLSFNCFFPSLVVTSKAFDQI